MMMMKKFKGALHCPNKESLEQIRSRKSVADKMSTKPEQFHFHFLKKFSTLKPTQYKNYSLFFILVFSQKLAYHSLFKDRSSQTFNILDKHFLAKVISGKVSDVKTLVEVVMIIAINKC